MAFNIKAILIVIGLTFVVCPLVTTAMMQAAMFHVLPGGDLQAAMNAANPGDTILLESNSDYVCPSGGCVFPVKSGSSFITITSTRADEIIGRATPSHAPLLARVRSLRSTEPTFRTVPGAHHFKLVGLEITPAATGNADNIVQLGAHDQTQATEQNTLEQVPHHFIIERSWIHGGATQEVKRGVALNSAHTTIRDSTINEIHGRGYDTQAICGWNGPGPFWIINNRLEAAGENILFGGADPSIPNLIPSDIQILGNHLFKPLRWKVGDPSYAGIHWTIKNLLELKMGRNVLIDGNLLENSWGDAQIGYGVLFTVRNQNGKAPHATIENVTYSNNVMRNTEQGFQLLGRDSPNVSEQASGLRIVNNLFENIAHWGFVVQDYDNVTIAHNTHFQGHNILVLVGNPSFGFVYENNVTIRDPDGFGIHGGGVGEGTVALETYTPGYRVAGNVIASVWTGVVNIYPPNNHFPTDLSGLATFVGTDGLVPGFMGIEAEPEPTPIASPSPTIEPTPSPSATPIVIVTRVVAWPNAKSKQDVILEAQWRERFRLRRNLSGQFAEFEFVGP